MMLHVEMNTEQSLFKNRAFLFLWGSGMCSAFSLSTYLFVEQWYVIHTLNQASFLGLVLMATLLPRIFLMLFGGVLSDRYKRSTIMRISSSLRISFILCLLMLLHTDQLTLLTILGFAFLFGSVDAFYSPANASLLPTLVPNEQLTKANSLIQTSNQIALFSGPILGGVILSYSSYSHVFLVIFGTLCLTLLFTYGIREAKTKRALQHSALSELKEGLHYVLYFQQLKQTLFLVICVNFFFFGPLLLGIPLLVHDVLQGDAMDLSYMQGAYQMGMLGGAVWSGFAQTKVNGLTSSVRLIGALGLFLCLLSQVQQMWLYLIILLSLGVLSSIINIRIITFIQSQCAEQTMGRVMSVVNASSNGLVPLSYALLSFLLSFHVSITTIMLYCGLLILVLSLYFRKRMIQIED